ncbi:MAG: 30S ribosome-binding factor RbfA [Campylobacteraceae bacterium]|nr:30S ribosome-binding factor RbfA [Campylobacteraceae bacterium]
MKNVNIQKTESLLMELIPEALSSLNDSRINALAVTAVNCKKGKYDAIVYFDGTDFTKKEIQERISLLNKASGRIKSFCLASTGWYKCPDFKFVSDKSIEKSRNIESLFAQISKSKKEEE